MQRTRIAAYGLVLEQDRILLSRIASHLPDAGVWTLPGGGMDFAEDPEVAMVREVFEETGLVVRARAVVAVNSIVHRHEDHDFQGIRIIYHTVVTAGTLTYEVDGSTDYCAWWTLAEAQKLRRVELLDIGLSLAFSGTTL